MFNKCIEALRNISNNSYTMVGIFDVHFSKKQTVK